MCLRCRYTEWQSGAGEADTVAHAHRVQLREYLAQMFDRPRDEKGGNKFYPVKDGQHLNARRNKLGLLAVCDGQALANTLLKSQCGCSDYSLLQLW